MKLTMMILSMIFTINAAKADALTEYDVCPTAIKAVNETGMIRLIKAYGQDAWLDCGYTDEFSASFKWGSSEYEFASQKECMEIQKNMDLNSTVPYSIKIGMYPNIVKTVKVISDKMCDKDGRAIWK
jgi:hypothetical protein